MRSDSSNSQSQRLFPFYRSTTFYHLGGSNYSDPPEEDLRGIHTGVCVPGFVIVRL